MKGKVILVLAAGAVLAIAALGTLFGLGIVRPANRFLLPKGTGGWDVVWTPDGNGLLIVFRSGSKDGAELLTLPRGRLRWRVVDFDLPEIPFEFQNRFAVFSRQGGRLAIGEANAIRILDPSTGEELSRWEVDGAPYYPCETPRGTLSFLVYKEGRLCVEERSWEGEILSREEIPHVQDNHAALSPDGRFLAYTGSAYDRRGFRVVNLRDLETGKERRWDLGELLPGLPEWGAVTGIALRPDAGEIAIALGIHKVGHPFLWRLDTGSGTLSEIPPPDIPLDMSRVGSPWYSPLAYSPDGKLLALSPGLQMVCVVDEGGTRVLWEGGAEAMAFSPDGEHLAFAAGRKVVVLPVAGGNSS